MSAPTLRPAWLYQIRSVPTGGWAVLRHHPGPPCVWQTVVTGISLALALRLFRSIRDGEEASAPRRPS